MQNSLTGLEPFTFHGNETGITLNDFWSWAFSDLLNNTLRGVMAEFLVSSTLPSDKCRIDWTPYDLISPTGRRIEVKSAAYLQAWEQEHFSKILFDISPRRSWSPETGYSAESKRHSDLYVFCVYTALSRDNSILNLDLWDFYVLPTWLLDEYRPTQKTISLDSLIALTAVKCDFNTLKQQIESVQLGEQP